MDIHTPFELADLLVVPYVRTCVLGKSASGNLRKSESVATTAINRRFASKFGTSENYVRVPLMSITSVVSSITLKVKCDKTFVSNRIWILCYIIERVIKLDVDDTFLSTLQTAGHSTST